MLRFLMFLTRSILSLRYRITFKNIELFDKKNPVIVFPNHPALVDPLILISNIGKRRLLSPVMTESYFTTPGLGPIVRALGTIPVGDLAVGGTIEDVKRAFSGIRQAMDEQKNILIYPSGHIYVQPFEHIVGKKMAYEMVGNLSGETRIILARTKGLWGSMWGKSYTGKSPVLMKVLMRSIGYMLANGIFFVPKRDIGVEFADMTEKLQEWHTLGLDLFNQNLQDYYNEGGNEVCRYIPHYFYHNDTAGKIEPEKIIGSIAEISSGSSIHREDIPSAIYEQVCDTIALVKKLDKKILTFETNLVLDLHADSLDMAELKSVIQSHFPGASNPPIGLIKTVGDLAALAIGKLEGEESLPLHAFVTSESDRIGFSYTTGDTILTCMKQNFQSRKKSPFIYDAMTGMMTRDQFLLKSYVIGEYLRNYKTEKIGIMLPALSVTSMLLVGTYLSGKLPVMLNWTVGEKSFAHCMNFAGLEYILTSRKFYEKISSPWLGEFESKMIFIEDIIRDISFSSKVRAMIKRSFFILPKTGHDAVMLFTSGSESLPKAVVLTHENILTDIEGALSLVPFQKSETLLGFLPPFHSFGFTINTIFPLIVPLQVAYTPNPNDARTIGKVLLYTHASIVSTTPTFLRMILANNDKETLESLKFAFVGAEKCSDEVFSFFTNKCPNGIILEGYGITECSPIVTVNTLDLQKGGSAGKFLPQVKYLVRSLDNKTTQKPGEQGMIYVSGPSIFDGYIDTSLESPFEKIEEEIWYKTGDLGYVDSDGFLYITGRLKRFVKIAGEMISLPFIESILTEKYGHPELTTLAIEAQEKDGVVTIVLFVTFDISLDEINTYIHAHGASNLVKITRIVKLDTIPVLGTGKTDYKLLKGMI